MGHRGGRRVAVGLVALGLVVPAACAHTVAASAGEPQAVLTDSEAEGGEGALIALGLRSGRQRLISSNLKSASGSRPRLVGPGELARGPDGTIYTADGYGGGGGRPAVLAIDPGSGHVRSVPIGGGRGRTRAVRPSAVAVDPGGSLVVSLRGSRPSLVRVDPRTGRERVLARYPRGGAGVPADLAVRADGLIAAASGGRVELIDPRTGRRKTFVTLATVQRLPGMDPETVESLLWRPDGHLWAGSFGDVVDIAPNGTQRVVAFDPRPDGGRDYSAAITSLAQAPDGRVLATHADYDSVRTGGLPEWRSQVVRVDPATERFAPLVDDSDSAARGGPALFGRAVGLVAEPSGSLLVAGVRGLPLQEFGPATLVRVDEATGYQRAVTPVDPPGAQGFDLPLAVTGDGRRGYVVADLAGNDPGGLGTGGLLSVSRSGRQVPITPVGSRFFDGPRDVFRAGSKLIAVTNVFTSESGLPPRVTEIDRATGIQTVVSSNALSERHGGQRLLARPAGILAGSRGHALVADTQAFGGPGGVISVDLGSGRQRVLSSNARSRRAGGARPFKEPTGIASGGRRTLLVADPSARRIIEVDRRTGAARTISSNGISARRGGLSAFRSPRDLVARGRWILVADAGRRLDLERDARVVLVDRRTGRQTRAFGNARSRRAGGAALMDELSGIFVPGWR